MEKSARTLAQCPHGCSTNTSPECSDEGVCAFQRRAGSQLSTLRALKVLAMQDRLVEKVKTASESAR